MDELELLKKDWKKQESSYPKLSYNEIYKMIHKKSSSIVKWIFIICIAEFVFWALINMAIPESYMEIYDRFHLKTALNISYIVHYIVLFGFMFLFYKNFKAISVIDNTNLLMQKIIKTRKTVNIYVYYNIILMLVLSLAFNLVMFSQPDVMMEVMNPQHLEIDKDKFMIILIIIQVVSVLVVCGLLWLYYRLIYGILLKKLNKNYKELETLEL
jgi:hypothetical protein